MQEYVFLLSKFQDYKFINSPEIFLSETASVFRRKEAHRFMRMSIELINLWPEE